MLKVWAPADPMLRALLGAHPEVELESEASSDLRFDRGDWPRSIHVGMPDSETAGIVELMDNNPLVCADQASLPDASATLALIALGPLVQSGLIKDEIGLLFSFEPNEASLMPWLSSIGLNQEVNVGQADLALDGVLALNVFAPITTPDDWKDLDKLYDEVYGGSFYVRIAEGSEWGTGMVAGKPWAMLSLRMTPGDETSLLTIRVMADANGKCGAAQCVHMLNVMAGFEECLGIPETLPTA